MVWIRGDRRDYDGWAAAGNPGWSYEDVLPYFREIEDNEAGADAWRGTGGAVHITDASRRQHPLAERFVRAGLEAGFDHNPDFNGATQEGVGVYKINTRGGRRMSAARAFLKPALKRPNLTLFKHTLARQVRFAARRATGVEIESKGRSSWLAANIEVILAAGAVNSPQILELSGIGAARDLTQLGVEVIADSPAVGEHMQDHLGINYVYRATVPTLNQRLRPWWGKLAAGVQYVTGFGGPLSLSLNQGGGFVRTRPELERPNIQLYFQAISTFSAASGTRPLLEPDPFPGFAIGYSNCLPTTRGSSHIRSADPRVAPAIRPNALGTDHDIDDMLEGAKLIRRLASQPALAAITAEELAPGPGIATDAELVADIRSRSGTVYHPCGTARIGQDPTTSVVDCRLRVHGVEGLRVADASVFPAIPSGNINAPTMMVARKAGAMILADRG
jgi:choline dehydrogenase